jgi:hypothetical protein
MKTPLTPSLLFHFLLSIVVVGDCDTTHLDSPATSSQWGFRTLCCSQKHIYALRQPRHSKVMHLSGSPDLLM